MTPKEKANELVQWFLDEGLPSFGRYQSTETEDLQGARFCATKVVDEIFKTGLLEGSTLGINKKYWQEVKQEIEKL